MLFFARIYLTTPLSLSSIASRVTRQSLCILHDKLLIGFSISTSLNSKNPIIWFNVRDVKWNLLVENHWHKEGSRCCIIAGVGFTSCYEFYRFFCQVSRGNPFSANSSWHSTIICNASVRCELMGYKSLALHFGMGNRISWKRLTCLQFRGSNEETYPDAALEAPALISSSSLRAKRAAMERTNSYWQRVIERMTKVYVIVIISLSYKRENSLSLLSYLKKIRRCTFLFISFR